MAISNLTEFLRQYRECEQIIQEYAETYRLAVSRGEAQENTEKVRLLAQLQGIENSERMQRAALQQRVAEQLNNLHMLLNTVDRREREISEKRWHKYKADNSALTPQEREEQHFTRDEISAKVRETIGAIEKITNSRMSKSLAAVCSFFNKGFHKNEYRQILAKRQELEQMILAAERDVHAVSAELQQEIVRDTLAKVAQLQAEKEQKDSERSTGKVAFLNQLRTLLLDGLERIFCGDTVYSSAHEQLGKYLAAYTSGDGEHLNDPDSLFVGLVNQKFQAGDDGTLDTFLSAILPDGVYAGGSLLLPVTLKKYFEKPIGVNYFAQYSTEVYTLFAGYAAQMMNLFTGTGVTVHLVDCTNMGGKYAQFTSFESSDENKRVHVVRTAEELKELLSELNTYIIESGSAYLKNFFPDVEQYNAQAAVKRELHVLLLANVSEVSSGEMMDKLVSIARNGNRSGVFTFLGVSTDECQVSNLVSQSRVRDVNTLLELCDRICMSSDGALSFGNGTPHFLVPPAVEPVLVQRIMENCVNSRGSVTMVPLLEHVLSGDAFFSQTCYDSIRIPVGVDVHGNEYIINLNRDAAYMLIGGNPSCGKSSLIHTIILQCITRYSPENLVLYVADLKDGSEFDLYVNNGVRSVKAALDDSEPDIAASFLNFIKSCVEKRLEAFGRLADLSGQIVRNIEQFYEVNNASRLVEHMPRMLVIIDEFQSLYNSSRVTGEITNWLVRMCRTVGIHIIMASQRAQGDSSASANSFSNQTKEYFIYRAMFKLPYSGAREIMAESCSDTGRENPALRRAQTLKSGQLIINPNMGATEEDNQIIQCYYPDNDTIAGLCSLVVEAQGEERGIILNSESGAAFDTALCDAHPQYVLGMSNRLYHDTCCQNTDAFTDDNLISLNPAVADRLIACGTDHRVLSGSFWAVLYKLSKKQQGNLKVCILAKEDTLSWLEIPRDKKDRFYVTASAEDFLSEMTRCHADGHFVYSVILNPWSFEALTKSDYSPASETVLELLGNMDKKKTFTLIIAENMKKMKDDCSYLDQEIPYRVVSVGNMAGIRSAMAFDAGDRLADSSFHTIRPGVVKAYYYNRETDKMGRMRMFRSQDVAAHTRIDGIIPPGDADGSGDGEDSGYAGLFGREAI